MYRLDSDYRPTTRESLLQGIIASQREQERIARRRRIARKHRRNEWIRAHETGIALAVMAVIVILGLMDWGWLG